MIFEGLNCHCGERHYQGARYYVTVARESRGGWQHVRLAGPYREHFEALAALPAAEKLAQASGDPRACWYLYGTSAVWNEARPGLFKRGEQRALGSRPFQHPGGRAEGVPAEPEEAVVPG